MTTVRLSPLSPARPGGRQRWTVGVSLLLHALALLALLTVARRPEDDGVGAPSYELMFEPAQPTAPAAGAVGTGGAAGRAQEAEPKPDAPPPPTPPQAQPPLPDALPGPTTPPATMPPVPDAPVVPPQPMPAEVPEPAPAAPAMPSAAPAPAMPAPSPPSQADVRLETPPDLPPPRPMVPEFVMPPPAPAPAPAPAPRPVPRAVPRPAPPPPTTGTFANPMDLNFGPSASRGPAARMMAPRGSVASRSLDLSPGVAKAGPNRADAFFDIRAANLGADWEQSLKSYWLRHRYYPRQAAESDEDGTVDLELTVDGSGRVQSAVVKSRSGSAWLDMAAVSTWRNAQLAPLPPELAPRYTFSITINYILIR